MKIKSVLVALSLLTAAAVYARDVYCPLHSCAPCYNTGEVATTGSGATKWHCTCGDDVWVAPEPPPQAQTIPSSSPQPSITDVINKELSAAQDRRLKQAQIQAAEAQAAALRAQSQSQKQMPPWLEQNNRNAVAYVYCRQHPNDNVLGFFGAQQELGPTCPEVIAYTKAFCSVNPEAGRCKLARSRAEVEQKFAALAEDFRTDPRRNKKDAQMYYDSLFDKLTKWGCMSFPDMSLPQRDGSQHPCPDVPAASDARP